MKRIAGIVLFVVGIVACFLTGMEAYQNTESFKLLGKQITFSQADWTPVIISGAVALVGIFLLATSSSKAKGRARR